MIEYIFLIIIVLYLVIDNYRLRAQNSREIAKQRIYLLEVCRATFHHTNNVLFEGDVVSTEELGFDGTKEELIDNVFNSLVMEVENEQRFTK